MGKTSVSNSEVEGSTPSWPALKAGSLYRVRRIYLDSSVWRFTFEELETHRDIVLESKSVAGMLEIDRKNILIYLGVYNKTHCFFQGSKGILEFTL